MSGKGFGASVLGELGTLFFFTQCIKINFTFDYIATRLLPY